MLSFKKKRESLVAKLLLSSALVAVSLAYGWWQKHNMTGPSLAITPAPSTAASNKLVSLPHKSAMTAPAPMAAIQPPAVDAGASSGLGDVPRKAVAVPQPQKPLAIASAAPQTNRPSVTPAGPEAQPQQNEGAASSPASLTKQQAQQMNLPTDGVSPPLTLVTGSPETGAGLAVPAGTHLEDGDYVSDKQEFAWGDLRVKISVHGGLITGVQILQYPDHRSQSLYLSQMAGPILESEVIKSQKAQVDVVSSATDTSYVFQDTVANAIMKATRG